MKALSSVSLLVAAISVGAASHVAHAVEWEELLGSYEGKWRIGSGVDVLAERRGPSTGRAEVHFYADVRGHERAMVREIWRNGGNYGWDGAVTIAGKTVTIKADHVTATLEYEDGELEGKFRGKNSGSYSFERVSGFSPPDLEKLVGKTFKGTWRSGTSSGPVESMTFGGSKLLGYRVAFKVCRGSTGSGCWPNWDSIAKATDDGYVRLTTSGRMDMLRVHNSGSRIKLMGWYALTDFSGHIEVTADK